MIIKFFFLCILIQLVSLEKVGIPRLKELSSSDIEKIKEYTLSSSDQSIPIKIRDEDFDFKKLRLSKADMEEVQLLLNSVDEREMSEIAEMLETYSDEELDELSTAAEKELKNIIDSMVHNHRIFKREAKKEDDINSSMKDQKSCSNFHLLNKQGVKKHCENGRFLSNFYEIEQLHPSKQKREVSLNLRWSKNKKKGKKPRRRQFSPIRRRQGQGLFNKKKSLNIEVNVNKYGSQGQRVNSPFRRRFKRHSMDEIMEFLGLQTEAQKGEMIYMTALLNGKAGSSDEISNIDGSRESKGSLDLPKEFVPSEAYMQTMSKAKLVKVH